MPDPIRPVPYLGSLTDETLRWEIEHTESCEVKYRWLADSNAERLRYLLAERERRRGGTAQAVTADRPETDAAFVPPDTQT